MRSVGLVAVGVLVAACGGGSNHWAAKSPPAEMAPVAATEATASEESYDAIVENDFLNVDKHPLSTFSIDVDTASYSNVRRFLAGGSLPPKDAVRIEELVNYFTYDYPQPEADAPFSMMSEVGSAPWKPEHRLVHIGLQGREIERGQLPPRNLVFLLDVSGSMGEPNKLPLLKRSLKELAETLNENDRVAIVVYAGASGLVLPSTRATERTKILAAFDRLEAGGGTNGGEGIQLAYKTARAAMTPGAINRVILATDGDFNVGITDQSELIELIERERKSGVYLSVLGFGMGNYKDSTLEKLADKGNGNYAYIDSIGEARKVLVQEAGATLVTIAKDVKIQVEFDPSSVSAYRLIGYENRLLKNEDFANDAKDAGEIGAGHSVTAIYEVVPTAQAERDAALMNVRLRYKQPNAEHSELVSFPVKNAERRVAETSDDFRFSAAVAAFGMLLRDSKHRGNANWELVSTLARGSLGQDTHGYRREFIGLVDVAKRLSPSATIAR